MKQVFATSLFLLLNSVTSLFSAEYGVGAYPLGYYCDLPGVMSPPDSLCIREDAYHVKAHLEGVHVTDDLSLFALYYTSHFKLLGGDFGCACIIPAGKIHVSAPISENVRKHQSAYGLGDIFFVPLRIGWHCDTLHIQFLQGFVATTGHYSKNRIANMSLNRWTSDSMLGISWLPPSRTEVSLFTGITVNFTNHKTHYRSGTEWHNDFMIAQYLTSDFKAGIAGYWYYQLTSDSGSGAVNGDFKGRLLGIGPLLAYDFKICEIPFQLRSHYFKDIYAKNHVHGYTFYLTLVFTLHDLN